MNRVVGGRRLASPVRVALATELGAPLDGAWWPHTASIARELPELVDALRTRLGKITAITVNWSPLESSPDLDALNRPAPGGVAVGDRLVGHQRLMRITGSQASANLLVVPCRTSAALAKLVLRRCAGLPAICEERDTQEFQTSDDIVRAARAESALCGRLGRDDDVPHAASADMQA
ncbi:DUF5994 family protein [Mycobacterium attenuatum]|uniref:Uncharacterized protein n=1 Tax=Mycobacterium attenuatum TaxID=2341086 RepID=A0A498PX56_9MYCO|nr:DUF5994 family protein [Mycobacterium attenuatum]VBA36308.1 hypothetical protein LAUMK136_01369 [Mycobacterium attenuatum]VBA48939.1 hypothetical protein LAUMK191_01366 [Mycobacterium attenuatum]VBA54376.1 hypothetical protein LAUMK41_01440 [Mycobacterium attenuatum]